MEGKWEGGTRVLFDYEHLHFEVFDLGRDFLLGMKEVNCKAWTAQLVLIHNCCVEMVNTLSTAQ